MKRAALCLCVLLLGAVPALADEFIVGDLTFAYDLPAGYVGDENFLAKLSTDMTRDLYRDFFCLDVILYQAEGFAEALYGDSSVLEYLLIFHEPDLPGTQAESKFAELRAKFMNIAESGDLSEFEQKSAAILAASLSEGFTTTLFAPALIRNWDIMFSLALLDYTQTVELSARSFTLLTVWLADDEILYICHYRPYQPGDMLKEHVAACVRVLDQLNLRLK